MQPMFSLVLAMPTSLLLAFVEAKAGRSQGAWCSRAGRSRGKPYPPRAEQTPWPNPSIEGTSNSKLRLPLAAPHVKR